VRSSLVEAFDDAPILFSASLYFAAGNFSVPRNMRCSKRCANPVWPGSTSLRDPVCTTMYVATMFAVVCRHRDQPQALGRSSCEYS
jgi:hypothetical protein